jgi:putative ABC transport system substrate-binding protein
MRGRIVSLIVILTLSLYAEVLPADTQEPGKMPRIGILSSGSPSVPPRLSTELRDLGYVDGQNIVLEYRHAKGNLNRLPDLAAELVNLAVDILVSGGIAASLAAKRTTTTIPIVFSGTTDPVGRGLVTNLARPGGNITGVSFDSGSVMFTKRLELLKKAVPAITRVAYIHGQVRRQTPDGERKAKERRERTAQALGLTIQYFRARQPEEIKERVFPAIKADPQPFDALYMAGPVGLFYFSGRSRDLDREEGGACHVENANGTYGWQWLLHASSLLAQCLYQPNQSCSVLTLQAS